MLKSLDLSWHAKARERNAGFREETADICSPSLPESYTERGGVILPSFCNQEAFPPIRVDFPPHISRPLVDPRVRVSFFTSPENSLYIIWIKIAAS
jgi:hypothetical protein